MGTILFYILGALVNLFGVLFGAVGFALDFLLDAPGLALVWGVFLWVASLLGDAGESLVAIARGSLAIGLVYLPFYVVRKFRLRVHPVAGGSGTATK